MTRTKPAPEPAERDEFDDLSDELVAQGYSADQGLAAQVVALVADWKRQTAGRAFTAHHATTPRRPVA